MSILLVLFVAPFVISALVVTLLLRSLAGLDHEFQPTRPAGL